MRRRLIDFRPIELIASIYDGVIVKHPAWFPVEVHATADAWKYHKDDILKHLKHLFGKPAG